MAATDNLNPEQRFGKPKRGLVFRAVTAPIRTYGSAINKVMPTPTSGVNPPSPNGSRPLGTGPAQPPRTGRFDNRPAAREERKTNRQAKWEAKHPE